MRVLLISLLLMGVMIIGVSTAGKRKTNSCVKKEFTGCRLRPKKNRCKCSTAMKCTNPYPYKTKKECKRHNRNICKQLNPCQNGGICVVSSRKYMCHCTGTGYYGKRCERECPTPDRTNTQFWKYPPECIQI